MRYDWTPWSDEQLQVMEAKWDEWAQFYNQFLDDGFTSGINLGTHNGAIQKAFERLGYQMYGIEYTDHIEELHAYGCRGERGNFFDMPQIRTEEYDFAIVDRALCSNMRTSWHSVSDEIVEKERIEILSGINGKMDNYGPPFFSEVSRIVKENGIIIVSFRTYMSRPWIDDISSIGQTFIGIDDRKNPYYVCVVRKGGHKNEIDPIDDFIDNIISKQDKELIYKNPHCMRIEEKENKISFLYTPDNRKIEISTSSWETICNQPYFTAPQ